jgi:hypothetical protein
METATPADRPGRCDHPPRTIRPTPHGSRPMMTNTNDHHDTIRNDLRDRGCNCTPTITNTSDPKRYVITHQAGCTIKVAR